MNLSVFRIILPVILLFSSVSAGAQDDLQTRRAMKHVKFWNAMTPGYTKLQFAGSMGMMSLGTGWNYGKNHWETDVLLGLVPRNSYHNVMITLTFKQNYIPWHIPLGGNKYTLEPLAAGMYVNFLLDRDFWASEPDKYPNGYYWFSTRMRTHIYLGERFTINLHSGKWPCKSLTFFYELSTCDLYLISRVKNHVLRPRDYMSLSFGVKMQIL